MNKEDTYSDNMLMIGKFIYDNCMDGNYEITSRSCTTISVRVFDKNKKDLIVNIPLNNKMGVIVHSFSGSLYVIFDLSDKNSYYLAHACQFLICEVFADNAASLVKSIQSND